MKKIYSDEALVATFIRTHSNQVFAELYRRYRPKVYQTCFRYLDDPDDADDQTQEIFSKVFAKLDTFRGEAKFSTWLFALSRFHCLSVLDSQKRRTQVSLDLVDEDQVAHIDSDELSLDERWQQAETTLGKLSHSDQDLLRRRYLGNKDVATLAGEDSVSLSAMKMRLKRARDLAQSYRQPD
ncbi:sigma-70 family RNA polymerase sigma factor [Fibrella sp. HMF5335]|uniref:Sigma-70 family RNA polymerase sigma factor n=1 Tax=Fibrella rubiginis TaxID=2817060 RepID=A0A939K8L6_9BACT|nr:sigma-70 family RNA polymerase sigma factor [Fibrella rubiginis]MBO0939865.1 sigma-70 family RNA polymerase sigma factor [Fibrella rubiginis]